MAYIFGWNKFRGYFGITLAADSGVVVTGRTGSIDYPTTVGSMQDSLSLSYDAVITRFDKNGNCLWSTYYGGTNFDGAYQVVTIGSTFVICGMTSSTDLPMLAPTQVGNNGSYDAFLLVLDWNGQLVRSTYYGGSGGDQGICLAKGPGNEIVLGGSATSTDLPFASSGFQATMAGQIDAFLAVFDNSLNVIWSTYYGGSNSEDIHSLCITPQQEIAFLGSTQSFDFPITANAWQMGLLNQPDNYLVKFGMDGSRHYATFLAEQIWKTPMELQLMQLEIYIVLDLLSVLIFPHSELFFNPICKGNLIFMFLNLMSMGNWFGQLLLVEQDRT